MSEIPEDSKEAVVEGLKKSKQVLGRCLFPAIVEKGTMVVLDGNTRKKSDPNWPEVEIEITDPKDRVLIPIHANYRRRVDRRESTGEVIRLIELLKAEGIADDQMVAKVTSLLPFSAGYTRSLIPDKYKNAAMSRSSQSHRVAQVASHNDSGWFKGESGDDPAEGTMAEMPIPVHDGPTCPHCRTPLSKVQCPKCMGDLAMEDLERRVDA